MRIPLASFGVVLGLAAAMLGQEPAVDPDLPAQLKQLRTLVKNPRMEDDLLAYDLVKALATSPDQRNPRDLDKIADAIGDVFHTGKVRPPEHARLYEQAATSLAALGRRGARPLREAVTDERFKGRDYAKVRASMITALGKTADDSQVEFLLEQALRSPDDLVLAAAGEALGNFPDLEQKQLREVVKRLISRYGEWVMKSTQLEQTDPNGPIDLGPQNARRTLLAIRDKWNTTLANLTGQNFSDAPEWQRWHNKNKDWVPPGRKN